MDELQSLLARYIEALQAGATATAGTPAHGEFMERLAGAGAVGQAVEANDLGRAIAILREEQRVLGWGHLPGRTGGDAQAALHRLFDYAQELRLRDRPPAW